MAFTKLPTTFHSQKLENAYRQNFESNIIVVSNGVFLDKPFGVRHIPSFTMKFSIRILIAFEELKTAIKVIPLGEFRIFDLGVSEVILFNSVFLSTTIITI